MDDALRWYRSKVDWWMLPLLGLPFLGAGAGVVAATAAGQSPLLALFPVLFLGALFGGLVLPMRYAVSSDELLIRHGLVTQRVRLADIVEVFPTRNPLSSPALSLDRLCVSTGTGLLKRVMISPDERDAFQDELQRRAGLTRVGERLVRG